MAHIDACRAPSLSPHMSCRPGIVAARLATSLAARRDGALKQVFVVRRTTAVDMRAVETRLLADTSAVWRPALHHDVPGVDIRPLQPYRAAGLPCRAAGLFRSRRHICLHMHCTGYAEGTHSRRAATQCPPHGPMCFATHKCAGILPVRTVGIKIQDPTAARCPFTNVTPDRSTAWQHPRSTVTLLQDACHGSYIFR
jgi:hypothetical protein